MDLIRQEDSSQATAPLQPESGLSVKQLLAAAGILFAVLCLFHGPLLIGTQIYCGGDVVNYFLPLRIQQLHHGWFAGWGPETFSGYPILDNIQSGAFYPLNWLHVVWGSPARVVTLLVLLNMYVGGIGMFCLLRGWCGMAASVLGAVAWMCSGYQLGKMAFGISVFMESLAWVPWMMLAIERQSWAAGRGRGWVGVLGLLGGIQLLAGAPQIVQITWAGLSVWTIGRFVAAPREARFALLKGFAVAVAITLMMAWPMLIGAMRFQANAVQRATEGGLAYLSTDSVQPHHLITWLAPGFFAPGNYEGVYWGGTTGWGEINAFVGSGLLVLALAGAVVALIGWRKAD
ncbi:hypothetical protein GC173_17265, partial [bacterium]|nr:hypothetical protein [bacterium]